MVLDSYLMRRWCYRFWHIIPHVNLSACILIWNGDCCPVIGGALVNGYTVSDVSGIPRSVRIEWNCDDDGPSFVCSPKMFYVLMYHNVLLPNVMKLASVELGRGDWDGGRGPSSYA